MTGDRSERGKQLARIPHRHQQGCRPGRHGKDHRVRATRGSKAWQRTEAISSARVVNQTVHGDEHDQIVPRSGSQHVSRHEGHAHFPGLDQGASVSGQSRSDCRRDIHGNHLAPRAAPVPPSSVPCPTTGIQHTLSAMQIFAADAPTECGPASRRGPCADGLANAAHRRVRGQPFPGPGRRPVEIGRHTRTRVCIALGDIRGRDVRLAS